MNVKRIWQITALSSMLLVGCDIGMTPHNPNSQQQKTIKQSHRFETVSYEGHHLIRDKWEPRAGFIHHPDCPCLKLK